MRTTVWQRIARAKFLGYLRHAEAELRKTGFDHADINDIKRELDMLRAVVVYKIEEETEKAEVQSVKEQSKSAARLSS